MKQKLQFPMFYLAWAGTVLAGVFAICSVSSPTLMLLGTAGLFSYIYFRQGMDEVTYKLLRGLGFLQLEFMLISLLMGQWVWAAWFLVTLALTLFEIDEEVRELGSTE